MATDIQLSVGIFGLASLAIASIAAPYGVGTWILLYYAASIQLLETVIWAFRWMPCVGSLITLSEEMQTRMEALQQEMADTEFFAAVGGGAVQVTVTGKGEMRGVKIDPSAVDAEDIGMLEDMICLAANNARKEADVAMAAKMKDITGGLPLPPGMSLPF